MSLRSVVKSLLDRLARWWLEEDVEDGYALDCAIDGQRVRCVVTRPIGMRLQVQTPRGLRMIGPADAVRRKDFWRIWKKLSGNTTLTWSDGTPVDVESL